MKYIYLIGFVVALIACSSKKKNLENTITQETQELISDGYYELGSYQYRMVVENESNSQSELPLLIVMHSAGSTPDIYRERVRDLGFPTRIIYLQAPHAFENGFTFFRFEPDNYYELDKEGKHEVILKETERLSTFISLVTKRYQPSMKPLVMGASQGGDLSYMLAIKYPELISGAIPLLATLDEKLMDSDFNVDHRVPVKVYHGVDDSVVSIDDARSQVAYLNSNNLDIELIEIKGCDHQITQEMIDGFKQQISEILRKL